MARTALEHALPAGWPDARASSGIDAVFDAHRQRQYSRELTTRSTTPSRPSCAPWCAAAPSAWRRWPRRWTAAPSCRAGGCACSTATACRRARSAWRRCGSTETGQVREQLIEVAGAPASWRRIELALDTPTEAGERAIRLWSNLPEEIGAGQIAMLHHTRRRVERSRSPGIEGMLIALPPEQWRSYDGEPPWPTGYCSWHATSIPARSPPASANPRSPSPRNTSTALPHGLMSPPHACSPRHG